MESNLFILKRKSSSPTPDSSEDFQLLENLDSTVESLINLGKIQKAFNNMSQALKIRISIYGDTSKEVINYISYILQKINFS